MNKNCIQIYNHKEHSYTIILESGDKEYIGVATCHPEDRSKESELFGFSLAELRAAIEELKDIAAEKRKELKVLKALYSNLKCYKDFNESSFEAKKLRRQIYVVQRDYDNLAKSISDAKEHEKDIIDKAFKRPAAKENYERLELLKQKLKAEAEAEEAQKN